MTAILKNWADNLGIKGGKVVQLDDAAYSQAAKTGDYDWMFVGAANGPTGDRAFNYFHSSALYPAGGNGSFKDQGVQEPHVRQAPRGCPVRVRPGEAGRALPAGLPDHA